MARDKDLEKLLKEARAAAAEAKRLRTSGGDRGAIAALRAKAASHVAAARARAAGTAEKLSGARDMAEKMRDMSSRVTAQARQPFGAAKEALGRVRLPFSMKEAPLQPDVQSEDNRHRKPRGALEHHEAARMSIREARRLREAGDHTGSDRARLAAVASLAEHDRVMDEAGLPNKGRHRSGVSEARDIAAPTEHEFHASRARKFFQDARDAAKRGDKDAARRAKAQANEALADMDGARDRAGLPNEGRHRPGGSRTPQNEHEFHDARAAERYKRAQQLEAEGHTGEARAARKDARRAEKDADAARDRAGLPNKLRHLPPGDPRRAAARRDAAVQKEVAKQRERLGLDRQTGPGADTRPNITRAREAAREAAHLKRRADVAAAAGDTSLAKSLRAAAKQKASVARTFHKRHKLHDAKRSMEGEYWASQEKKWRDKEKKLRAEGRTREADAALSDAEDAGIRSDAAKEADGVKNKQRHLPKAVHEMWAEARADRKRREAKERADARALREGAVAKRRYDKAISPEGQAKAKRARIRVRRAAIRERMRQERRKSYGAGHAFAKGRTAEIMAAKRARAYIAKVDKRVAAEHASKEAAKKAAKWAARAAPFKKAAKWTYKAATGKDYKRKLSDKEQLVHAKAVEKELAKKSREVVKQLRDAHALRREAKARLKRAAAAREIPEMRVPGSESERAWAKAVREAEQAKARVAAAKQELADHRLRRKAAANVRAAIHDRIEKSIGAKVGRAVGKVKHVLGVPGRKVKAIRSAIATKFLEFKKKHGIDKPLKPDQRKTIMQKLFGSDKGYRGEAYVAGGMGGVGMMFLTGRSGFQHPDHRAKMRELDEEMRHAHEEVPHVLHKGAKGGIFYYSPEGKKVYITRGGIGGLLSIHKMFKAGRSGARLYR